MKKSMILLAIVVIVISMVSGTAQASTAQKYTYGEIRNHAIMSVSNFTSPPGLANAVTSIGAVCGRGQSCASLDGSTAQAPADKAAWKNICDATGGEDLTGGGNYMCVGTQQCTIVHSCKNDKGKMVSRKTSLNPSGSVTVGSTEGITVYFYKDSLLGNCPKDTTVIPEFTTIAIPVAAILGILFLFSRRRQKR